MLLRADGSRRFPLLTVRVGPERLSSRAPSNGRGLKLLRGANTIDKDGVCFARPPRTLLTRGAQRSECRPGGPYGAPRKADRSAAADVFAAAYQSECRPGGPYGALETNIDSAGRPYIIAELGVNHDGSLTRAMELVEAARAAEADTGGADRAVSSAP